MSATGAIMSTEYSLPLRRSKPAQEYCVRLPDCPDMTIVVYWKQNISLHLMEVERNVHVRIVPLGNLPPVRNSYSGLMVALLG